MGTVKLWTSIPSREGSGEGGGGGGGGGLYRNTPSHSMPLKLKVRTCIVNVLFYMTYSCIVNLLLNLHEFTGSHRLLIYLSGTDGYLQNQLRHKSQSLKWFSSICNSDRSQLHNQTG